MSFVQNTGERGEVSIESECSNKTVTMVKLLLFILAEYINESDWLVSMTNEICSF